MLLCNALSLFHRYLGHLYAAEALIRLDKISEAIPELSPEKITDLSTSLEFPFDIKQGAIFIRIFTVFYHQTQRFPSGSFHGNTRHFIIGRK